ncbi:MAG: ParA family protein [Kordiimonadaceae bacterium]|nr:ParA family protein [Kordiimonadaceae bacterium]
MPTITFASTKGGSTKTTSAITFAVTLADFDPEMIITMIDCDPERYLSDWAEATKEQGALPKNLKVIREPRDEHIADAIHDAEEYSDFVIIDPEGKATMLLRGAILLSDLTLIPLQPSAMDAKAIPKIVDVIDRAARSRRDPVIIDYAALFTRTNAGIGRSIEQKEIISGCSENGVPMLMNELHERNVYKGYASVAGTLVSRMEASEKRLAVALNQRDLWAAETTERKAKKIKPLTGKAKTGEAELKQENRGVITRERALISQLEKAIENAQAVTNEILSVLEIAMNKRSAA